ncbi:hypothetical protein FLL45_12245 [Aliikangiella marina]|uniref:Peptidase M12A domain-containing protein n=1 Tax=Aliikangiella marina TaxID=1712262 RepID=A0A545T8Y4_9GAMM|nr:pre-peptidase C-terminal domain-containing protein [Aliikangiella marina]TQV73638.1 hypothetical protein FLL45_12245 [Aliikangiella marina]
MRPLKNLLLLLITFSTVAINASSLKNNQIENSTISSTLINYEGKSYQVIDDMWVPDGPQAYNFDMNKDKWKDGKVYYEFAEDVTAENRERFIDAYRVWESVAELEFIERTVQENYIYVQNDNRNYAIVGMVGGKQILSMVSWHSKYIIVHEIGHSLGMWHEHMRSDRDEYVTILEDNINPNQRYNFTKRQTLNYSSYDFLSIMHYGLGAYSTNGSRTIEPHPQYFPIAEFAGQRNFISGGDQIAMARRYGAKKLSFSDQNFESYLLNNFDVNGDGAIDSIEAASVTNITTPGNGTITSIEGIQHFRYLNYLNVSNENLESLPELPSRLDTLIAKNNYFTIADFNWHTPPLISYIDVSENWLDIYQCENLIDLKNALGDGHLVYSPAADGSIIICDETTQNQLLNGRVKEDLRSKGVKTFYIDVPANQTQLIIQTIRYQGLGGGLMDLYVAFDQIPNETSFDYASENSGNTEFVEISNPSEGRWYITLVPNDRSFENVSLTATYTEQSIDSGKLQNGIAKSQLSANENEVLNYYIDIPQNAQALSFQIQGGVGDADLYVKAGSEPTLTSFDCRPYKNGNQESCSFNEPETTRYYVAIIGYKDFSGLSLVANYQVNEPPQGGFASVDNLQGIAQSWQYFNISIPADMSLLTINISGGSGDADLYVDTETQPSLYQYSCRPYKNGNAETCSFENPRMGNWYIGIRGYTDYNGVTLSVEWQ